MKALASEASFVKLLVLSRRVEESSAVSAGVDYALGDILVTLNGNLESASEDVPRVLNALLASGADHIGLRPSMVCGWRGDRRFHLVPRVAQWVMSWLKVTQVPRSEHEIQSGGDEG